MKLLVIADDEAMVDACVASGIDRIFIDLEIDGKIERQASLSAHLTKSTIHDVSAARKLVPINGKSELLVRVNPISDNSKAEIDTVISLGADHVMLPMFRHEAELGKFLEYVAGRVATTGLFETAQALARVRMLVGGPWAPHEAHLGLNDLSLSMGLDFLMEPLAGGLVDHFCGECAKAGIPYGFGGVGALGTGLVPAELILSEHVRLGSTSVILSRTFRDAAKSDAKLFRELVDGLRACIECLRNSDMSIIESNRRSLVEAVHQVVSGKS